jgi:hypothetical protein
MNNNLGRPTYQDLGMMPPGYGGQFSNKVRILVTLRKSYGSSDPYKKMMLVVSGQEKVSGLKRAIEREFMELFPVEPPYVVAKLEDANGFSLSNGSNIADFIQNG